MKKLEFLEVFNQLTEIDKFELIKIINSLKKINIITLVSENKINYIKKEATNENFNFFILNFENNILKLAFKNKDIEINNLKFIEIENLAKNYFKEIDYKILNNYSYLKITI